MQQPIHKKRSAVEIGISADVQSLPCYLYLVFIGVAEQINQPLLPDNPPYQQHCNTFRMKPKCTTVIQIQTQI